MLVSTDDMKEALGLPLTADPVADPILERSSVLSQKLVSSYVGFSVEADQDNIESYYGHNVTQIRIIRLPKWPAQLVSFQIDGVGVPDDQYKYDTRTGVITFFVYRPLIKEFLVQYVAGFDGEVLPVPEDLLMAIQNIALGLYARNGNLQQSGASGALKSLTMFDAMSMSFDVGTTTADSSTPEGIVKQWAFVLDQYSVKQYVMGS